jgi:hypothetical protein
MKGAMLVLFPALLVGLRCASNEKPPSGGGPPSSQVALDNRWQDRSDRHELVFMGTVASLAPTNWDDRINRWVVTMRVDRTIAGEYTEEYFQFAVHSPTQSCLETGKSYQVCATWTGMGYKVDQRQWCK